MREKSFNDRIGVLSSMRTLHVSDDGDGDDDDAVLIILLLELDCIIIITSAEMLTRQASNALVSFTSNHAATTTR